MKKVIYLIIISLSMCLTFSFTSKAISPKIYAYEEVDIVYNVNFIETNYYNESTYIEIVFTLESIQFIDNPYFSDLYEDYWPEYMFFHVKNFDNSLYSFYSTTFRNIVFMDDNKIHASVRIPKEVFTYYIEEIAQTTEIMFFTRFRQDYLADVSEYFQLFVKAENKYESGYDDGYWDGYIEGVKDAFEDGYNQGYDEGYDLGYDDGFNVGDNAGYTRGLNDGTSAWGVLFSTMLSTFGAILSIEIFPNLTIGMIAAVPLILGLLAFIIGVAKGGRRND